jgi:hypothetical protein
LFSATTSIMLTVAPYLFDKCKATLSCCKRFDFFKLCRYADVPVVNVVVRLRAYKYSTERLLQTYLMTLEYNCLDQYFSFNFVTGLE